MLKNNNYKFKFCLCLGPLGTVSHLKLVKGA